MSAPEPVVRPATGPRARVQPVTRRVIGDSDLAVPPVAFGAKVFGWLVDDAEAKQLLDVYLDGGGALIDTADSYAGGRSEIMIGSWLASRGARDRIVLATKVGKSADHPGLAAASIAGAVEASLQRLRVEAIDLLFLHVDDARVPFEETLFAVDRLIREGKVRAFGGADHVGNRLVEARIASGLHGVAPLVAVQHEYSLMHRTRYERDIAPVAESLGLGVLPRFPLAAGFLSGEIRTRAELRSARRQHELEPYFNRRGLKVLGALEAIADEAGVSMATAAIAWLLSKPNVVAPIVAPTKPQHVAEMLAAPAISLTRQQLADLDAASA